MTPAERLTQYHRMAAGEIPWGLIDGLHPGQIGARWSQEQAAAFAAAKTPDQWFAVAKKYGVDTPSMQALEAQYRAHPDGFEVRGGTVTKKKNALLNALQDPLKGPAIFAGAAIGIPALINSLTGAAAGGAAGAAGGGGGAAAGTAGAAGGAGAAGAAGGAAVPTAAGAGFLGGYGPMLLGTGINTATSLYGAHQANQANERATEAQLQANREALEEARRQWELEQQQYLEERARNWGIEDSDRTRRMGFENERRARLTPWQSAWTGLSELAPYRPSFVGPNGELPAWQDPGLPAVGGARAPSSSSLSSFLSPAAGVSVARSAPPTPRTPALSGLLPQPRSVDPTQALEWWRRQEYR